VPPQLPLGEDAFLAALLPARLFVRTENDVASQRDRNLLAVSVFTADDDEVSVAALGELALDARHPGAAGAAVGAGRVQEDAGVAHEFAAVGALAPLVLDGQVIVLVLLVGGDVAVAVAADVQHTVLRGEDFLRVVALAVAEPGREAGEVLAVEEFDLFGGTG